MKLRTFTVPFAEIVAADALELEFSDSDYLVIRPVFGQPVGLIRPLQDRLRGLSETASEDDADLLALEFLERAVVEWHLEGPDGPIARPRTVTELDALPGAIRGALLSFLMSFRGRSPDPTSAG
jgi:hypothetical protein